jgi:hypothetical protein
MSKTAKVMALKSEDEIMMIPYATDVMRAGRLRVIVDGVGSLLTHNPASMSVSSGSDAMKGGRIPMPEDEAEAGVYRLEDGTCGIRGDAFRASALAAAGAWRMKKSTARTRLAHMVVIESIIPLCRKDGKSISDYAIDGRRAIIQKQGIIRHRPRFDEWSATFTIEYDPVLVPDPKLIVDIFADAGGRIGVGDYRPARNGWFGRYRVRSYAVLD